MKKNKSIEDRIIEAAADVFEEKGFAGSRMQQIADHAKINKSLLHYYFRSKESLFEKTFILIAKRIIERLGNNISFKGSICEKLTQFLEVNQELLWKNRNFLIFFINEVNQNKGLLKKLMTEINIYAELNTFFQQIEYEQKIGILRNDIESTGILVNIISLSIFPFLGKPMIDEIMAQLNLNYDEYIDVHKKQISQFIINSIKNPNYKE